MTVAQIARRMGLARQGVQRIVNDLIKLGMVEVNANIDHKRAPLVSISSIGNDALVKIAKAQIAWVNLLSDGLSDRQINQALKLLQTVRGRCEKTIIK